MPTRSVSAERAEVLRGMHDGPRPLVLPNAWDAASALTLEACGFRAIATTSGGVAATLGYPDGEVIPADQMFAAVSRIAAAVQVPVTADLEAGYGLQPDELVDRVIESGAVGFNLEDSDHGQPGSLVDADAHATRIANIKGAGRRAGVDLVVNARVDVHIRQVRPQETRIDEAVRRALLYRDAGADCTYPIGPDDDETVSALVLGIEGPVNIIARPDEASISRLAALGVARITFGSRLHRTALAELTSVAAKLHR